MCTASFNPSTLICGRSATTIRSCFSAISPRNGHGKSSSDTSFMDRIQEAESAFEDYINNAGTYSFNLERPIDYRIAYFSMEFGLCESLPIYSGGLGVLSGDHLKSASNLCFPLIGMGLLYQKGYFKQYLNVDGWQQESYPDNDFFNLPLSHVLDGTGNQASFDLESARPK